MELEGKAIDLIVKHEPQLQRTEAGNRGFDLYEPGEDKSPVRWVEVKAMAKGFTSRPVCLSKAQFECAWVHRDAFWLYVVEHAGEADKARVFRIKDPAGRGRSFTFDSGWEQVAETYPDEAEHGDP